MDAGLRELVWNRAVGLCECCRMPDEFDPLPYCGDHIISQQHRLTRLFHPRADDWLDPFEWDEAVLMGQPPLGRTTIDVLSTNDAPRMDHRRCLIEEQAFPPVERRFY